MPRILIAECKQEVSTFNPHRSEYEDFDVRWGRAIVDYHRTVRNEIGGALSVWDLDPDVRIVPAYSAVFITSGGTLRKSAWERIASEFLDSLEQAHASGPLDGVYFCMHGAMASEEEWDPEGYLLEQARQLLGDAIPIVVSLDLHGILTDRILAHADAIVAYHTYPHVDFYSTGQRAAHLLLKILRSAAKPITAKVAIPALVRGDELITETGSFGQCIEIGKDAERQSAALSAGMFIGNPFTDVPSLQSYSFAITDGDPDLAGDLAFRMADLFWKHHEKMQVPLVPLSELPGVMSASQKTIGTGTLALVDAADATSSGASGDSNAVLRALLETRYAGRTLIPMVDAPAVQKAFAAGVGQTMQVTVGGTLDPGRFAPLAIEGTVKLLSDGRFRSESFGEVWNAGRTAVVESGPYTLVISSRAVSLYDRSFFYAHGQNPQAFDAVVVKSPHCQPHMYSDWCSRMILIDAPGSSSANLLSLGHTRCPRPIFPLDKDVVFHPVIQFFQRPRYRS